ncbi:hypothetical protein KCU62_g320, partial [Aureobasidium sp. EXF-3399]
LQLATATNPVQAIEEVVWPGTPPFTAKPNDTDFSGAAGVRHHTPKARKTPVAQEKSQSRLLLATSPSPRQHAYWQHVQPQGRSPPERSREARENCAAGRAGIFRRLRVSLGVEAGLFVLVTVVSAGNAPNVCTSEDVSADTKGAGTRLRVSLRVETSQRIGQDLRKSKNCNTFATVAASQQSGQRQDFRHRQVTLENTTMPEATSISFFLRCFSCFFWMHFDIKVSAWQSASIEPMLSDQEPRQILGPIRYSDRTTCTGVAAETWRSYCLDRQEFAATNSHEQLGAGRLSLEIKHLSDGHFFSVAGTVLVDSSRQLSSNTVGNNPSIGSCSTPNASDASDALIETCTFLGANSGDVEGPAAAAKTVCPLSGVAMIHHRRRPAQQNHDFTPSSALGHAISTARKVMPEFVLCAGDDSRLSR